MTTSGWLQIALFSLLTLAVAKPLGLYLVSVFEGRQRWLRAIERPIYALCGVSEQEEQHWTRYLAGVLLFSAVSMLLTYVVLRLQHVLPLNPQALPAPTWIAYLMGGSSIGEVRLAVRPSCSRYPAPPGPRRCESLWVLCAHTCRDCAVFMT